MAVTEYNATGNGTTKSHSFTFPYIEESDVKVSLNGTDLATTEYFFSNATTIEFNTLSAATSTQETSGAPKTGVLVRIYRDTDIDDLKATFFAGSSIKAEDLNDNFRQSNYLGQEIKNTTWDNETETVHSDETWSSNNTQIATTAAIDARFFDNESETLESTETWSPNDTTIGTTQAIENRINSQIDAAIEGDVLIDGTGLTKSASGGQVTLGIGANSVDFDRIKNDDIITQAEQDASSVNPADTNIFTASAAARRFDTLVQTGTPSGSDWETGKTWYQNDEDKTVYVWDGNSWEAITSGGAFTRLDQVIYVDATNGDDNNNGHRISTPKKTIKSALAAINSDSTYGDGSTILVAPGVYKETAPLDIEKKDVAIIGASVRNVIVHPTQATETNSLFRVNSGTYLQNMTFTGMKASGTRGDTGSLWEDTTYGLPPTQGWNVSFYPNAMIYKSPYIQNCTNFSDSEIDNDNLDFYTGDSDRGQAGDSDHAPTGGGLLVNGATVHADSPLRSMVADSYTHVGLDGPGIFVTNNGYTQITSSYAFFNHFHIACINGGQANLAASTSDFGRFSLVASGKSTSDIFDGLVKGTPSAGDTTFVVDGLAANSGWHGSAVRPASNMLVEVGGNLYPILSATRVSDTEFTVEISRPDANDRTQNLGLSNSPADNSAVKFYLRSQIASSGHTMEYVGAGLDYRALPENATGTYTYGATTKENGVPIEAHQKIELDNGKIWAAITDHNGKFRVGETFSVDQTTGFVNIPAGALSVSKLLADLDTNNKNIVNNSGNVTINDTLSMNSNKIVNVTNPTAAQDAATKNYVDNFEAQTANIGDLQVTGDKIANTTIDSSKLTGATVVTNSEHSAATVNDTSFFTTSASDARYFRQDSSETIASGDTWSSSDSFVATTGAINARIIDLVEEVGGFVPIADETSFPAANPDINNGTGTLISIQEIATSRTPSSGTVTIANGSGSNTVTITGCGSTVLAAGYGCIVETTSTLHTYTFHRLTPLATEVSTLASNVTSINTVAGSINNVNTFANVYQVASANPTTRPDSSALVEGDLYYNTTSDVIRAYNGTAYQNISPDAATLADIAIVADDLASFEDLGSIADALTSNQSGGALETCADNITDIRTLADIEDGTDATDAIQTVAGISSNVTTVAGVSANVTTVATDIANVNTVAADLNEATSEIDTVATNITNVNNVGNDISNVNTVAGQISPTNNIATVAGANSNISTVAGQISPTNNISTVAGKATDISTVAGQISPTNNISTVAGAATNIGTVAGSITNVNTVASNISDVNSFADQYTISATQPASPSNGDLWYDSTNNLLKFYDGTSWNAISSGGIANIVEDTTPQLGGTLDGQNNNLSNIGTIDGTNLQIDFGTI